MTEPWRAANIVPLRGTMSVRCPHGHADCCGHHDLEDLPIHQASAPSDSRGGQADVVIAIKQRLSHAALDAESLGRILLMLEWLVSSGAVAAETVDQLLERRPLGKPFQGGNIGCADIGASCDR